MAITDPKKPAAAPDGGDVAAETDAYVSKRRLKTGTAGWVPLALVDHGTGLVEELQSTYTLAPPVIATQARWSS